MLSETKKLSEGAKFNKVGLFPKLSGCLHEEAPELPPRPGGLGGGRPAGISR